MDGFISLLVFAGLFYLMMRFGCGAHMISTVIITDTPATSEERMP